MSGAGAPGPPARSPLAQQLGQVCVGLRRDLVVTRHVFRGEAGYVLRDPLSFESQRFEPADYELLLRIRPERPLADLFAELVEEGTLEAGDEDAYYGFVLDLHRKRLLKLPIADDKILFGRHEQRRQAERRALWMAPMFFRRRLFDPDPFLARTERFVRPLFTRTAACLWLAVVLTGLGVAIARADELVEPLGQVLLLHNLPLLWLALVGLKIVHELGHAYATRHFGGQVPEIGVNLIVLTPLPYVDASAAWSFSSKAQRLLVSLAGMIVELFVAALAILVWSATEASVLNAFAYLVAFTGSVVTLLFNLNPLMKFDGYYVLSDLIEIPNLRKRSVAYVRDLARRWLFGLPREVEEEGVGLRTTLATFGVASGIYKATLVLGLSAGIALRFPAVGLGMAGAYVLMELAKLAVGLWRTVGEVREHSGARVHGALGLLGVGVLLPAAILAVPVPRWATAPATVEREQELTVHAETQGFLEPSGRIPGQPIAAGEVLATLVEPEEEARLAEGRARLAGAELAHDATVAGDPGAWIRARAELDYAREDLVWREAQAAAREPVAPVDGVLLDLPREDERGRFIQVGEVVGRIAGGRPTVRAVVRDDEAVGADLRDGALVRFRPEAAPGWSLVGTIESVEPLAIRELGEVERETISDRIAIDPATGQPLVPHFAVRIRLDDPAATRLPDGATGRVWLAAEPEPLARRMVRPLARFLDRLRQ